MLWYDDGLPGKLVVPAGMLQLGTPAGRKLSTPAAPTAVKNVPKPPRRRISCPGPPASHRSSSLKLKNALSATLSEEPTEIPSDIPTLPGSGYERATLLTCPKTEASRRVVATRPKVMKDNTKAAPAPRPPTVVAPPSGKKEMKRGNMKERWGVRLVYVLSLEEGLCVGVVKVTRFTASEKAKIQPGDTIVTINDWTISNMREPTVAANLLSAAGFSVILGMGRSDKDMQNWNLLGDF